MITFEVTTEAVVILIPDIYGTSVMQAWAFLARIGETPGGPTQWVNPAVVGSELSELSFYCPPPFRRTMVAFQHGVDYTGIDIIQLNVGAPHHYVSQLQPLSLAALEAYAEAADAALIILSYNP